MSTRRLALQEYRTDLGVPLTPLERGALQRLLPSVAIAPSAGGGPDVYDLTPGSWVGVLDLGPLLVEIRPKLPIRQVLFLISYALDPSRWRDEPLPLAVDDQSGLLEAVVPAFTRHARRATCRGLLQGYRSEEAALAGVRGRPRLEEQVRRRAGTWLPVELRYDELTVDVAENRLLKTAAQRLRRLPLRHAESGRALRALEATLQGVSTLPAVPAMVDHVTRPPTVAYTRLNQHYRPAVELARLVLRASSFGLGNDQTDRTPGETVPATGFLVDMSQVFEDFVVVALREALGLSERAFPQGAAGRLLRLDQAGSLPLRPDFSWWEGARCRFVGDAKYRRSATGEHADLYQLLAYAVAADLPGGLLVYAAGPQPQPGQDRTATRYDVRHTGKRLQVASLDLGAAPADLLAQVAALADDVRALATKRPS